jgi:hypothetical protein
MVQPHFPAAHVFVDEFPVQMTEILNSTCLKVGTTSGPAPLILWSDMVIFINVREIEKYVLDQVFVVRLGLHANKVWHSFSDSKERAKRREDRKRGK